VPVACWRVYGALLARLVRDAYPTGLIIGTHPESDVLVSSTGALPSSVHPTALIFMQSPCSMLAYFCKDILLIKYALS